jgi:hypothetical protein
MTAQVIELHPGLKRLPPDPECLRERTKDRLADMREIVGCWFAESPIVIARRKTIKRRERAAFELGRESVRRLHR